MQFQARSAISIADRQYAYSLAKYDMRMQLYLGNNPGDPMVPNEQEDASDGSPMADQGIGSMMND